MKRLTLLLLCAILLASCQTNPRDIDYFSGVMDVCSDSPVRTAADALSYTLKHQLTPECRNALVTALGSRIEHPSWTPLAPGAPDDGMIHAPSEAYLDALLNTFHRIVSEPLIYPADHSIFGHGNPIMLAGTKCALGLENSPDECLDSASACELPAGHPQYLNCRLFNYILGRTDRYYYGGPHATRGAHNEVSADLTASNLAQHYVALNDGFFWVDLPGDEEPERFIESSPYARIGLLAHETRHSDGFFHGLFCRDGIEGSACDPNLNGPYGLQIYVNQALLLGQREKRLTQIAEGLSGPFSMHGSDILSLTAAICYFSMSRVGHGIPPELIERIYTDRRWYDFTSAQFAELSDMPWVESDNGRFPPAADSED